MPGIKPHLTPYAPPGMRLTAIHRLGEAMRTTLIAIGALFLSPIFLTNAAAAQTPGQFNTYSTPNGAYVGQPPAYTSQLPNGAPVVHTPGQPPIFGTPAPNGGYVIQRPGQQPTYINPQ